MSVSWDGGEGARSGGTPADSLPIDVWVTTVDQDPSNVEVGTLSTQE